MNFICLFENSTVLCMSNNIFNRLHFGNLQRDPFEISNVTIKIQWMQTPRGVLMINVSKQMLFVRSPINKSVYSTMSRSLLFLDELETIKRDESNDGWIHLKFNLEKSFGDASNHIVG